MMNFELFIFSLTDYLYIILLCSKTSNYLIFVQKMNKKIRFNRRWGVNWDFKSKENDLTIINL